MAKLNKRFAGKYDVELDNEGNEEFPTQCFIEYVSTAKKSYTASLQCLLDCGYLESSDGYSHHVENAIIDDIEEWAIENGY